MRLVYFYYNDNGISYSDTSNSFFLPGNLQSPIIEILNPNGGEIFQEQSLTEISWFSTGDIGGAQVHIGYSLNGGATWFDALNNDDETSNPPRYGGWNNAYYSWNSVDNSGSYEWTLPSIVDTSSGCLLGIWSVSNNNIYKTSQNAFTINSDSNFYRIISPNGDGEIFQKQKYHIISWEEGGTLIMWIYIILFLLEIVGIHLLITIMKMDLLYGKFHQFRAQMMHVKLKL